MSVVKIPWRRLRVVWATGDVMAIFWPTRVFIKVDLPTLGRPIMPMNPDLNAAGAVGMANALKSNGEEEDTGEGEDGILSQRGKG